MQESVELEAPSSQLLIQAACTARLNSHEPLKWTRLSTDQLELMLRVLEPRREEELPELETLRVAVVQINLKKLKMGKKSSVLKRMGRALKKIAAKPAHGQLAERVEACLMERSSRYSMCCYAAKQDEAVRSIFKNAIAGKPLDEGAAQILWDHDFVVLDADKRISHIAQPLLPRGEGSYKRVCDALSVYTEEELVLALPKGGSEEKLKEGLGMLEKLRAYPQSFFQPQLCLADDGEFEGPGLLMPLACNFRAKLEGRKFKPWEKLKYTLHLCMALRDLHREDIAHRDLKPGNLMIGLDGKLRIIDFGLATKDELVGYAGTAGYIAPELQKRKSSGIRADCYSAGIIIAQLFFVEFDPSGIEGEELEDTIKRLRRLLTNQINGQKTKEPLKKLCEVILGLIRPNPEDRITSKAAAEKLVDLDLSALSRALCDLPQRSMGEKLNYIGV